MIYSLFPSLSLPSSTGGEHTDGARRSDANATSVCRQNALSLALSPSPSLPPFSISLSTSLCGECSHLSVSLCAYGHVCVNVCVCVCVCVCEHDSGGGDSRVSSEGRAYITSLH